MTLTPTQTQQILDWCDKHGVEKPNYETIITDWREWPKGKAEPFIRLDDLLDWLHAVLGGKENPIWALEEPILSWNTRLTTIWEAGKASAQAPTLHEALYRSAYQVEYGKKSVDEWFDEVTNVLEELKK